MPTVLGSCHSWLASAAARSAASPGYQARPRSSPPGGMALGWGAGCDPTTHDRGTRIHWGLCPVLRRRNEERCKDLGKVEPAKCCFESIFRDKLPHPFRSRCKCWRKPLESSNNQQGESWLGSTHVAIWGLAWPNFKGEWNRCVKRDSKAGNDVLARHLRAALGFRTWGTSE